MWFSKKCFNSRTQIIQLSQWKYKQWRFCVSYTTFFVGVSAKFLVITKRNVSVIVVFVGDIKECGKVTPRDPNYSFICNLREMVSKKCVKPLDGTNKIAVLEKWIKSMSITKGLGRQLWHAPLNYLIVMIRGRSIRIWIISLETIKPGYLKLYHDWWNIRPPKPITLTALGSSCGDNWIRVVASSSARVLSMEKRESNVGQTE